MKRYLFFLILFIASFELSSQEIYNTSSIEMIFGYSNAAYDAPTGVDLPNNNTNGDIADAVRWTVWLHVASNWHMDFSNNFGFYTGFSNRNIGFITKEGATKETIDLVKWKRRTYAMGIPLVFKFGDMSNGFYLFAGGQYEFFYHYKEKEFLPSSKRKYTEWFSDRVNMFVPSVLLGISFPKGLNVKLTLSLDDMMNRKYSYRNESGETITPYKYMDSKLIYLSFFRQFRTGRTQYKKKIDEDKQIAVL